MPYNYGNQSQSLTILTSQQKRTTIGPNTQFITPNDKPYFDERKLGLDQISDGRDDVDGDPGLHGDDGPGPERSKKV